MSIKFFENVKSFYVIGIGGISTSALALFLINRGYTVRGSDMQESAITQKLTKEGIEVFIPNGKDALLKSDIIIYTSAIKKDDKELALAKKSGKMIFSRAEFLHLTSQNFKERVYICGSHGKTTATAMTAHIFSSAGKKITSHIGGEDIILSNMHCGGDDFFISEACEYQKNLSKLKGETVVLLNSDCDHMDSYKNKEELDTAFYRFLRSAKREVVNIDERDLITPSSVTFGLNKGCYHAENISEEKGRYSFDAIERDEFLCRVNLNVYGEHNILNALSAIAVARLYNICASDIEEGLKSFKGIKRRFENIGSYSGANVICDYAHHPSEITASLKTALKVAEGRLFVIFQPHTYSRTRYLFDDFCKSLEGFSPLIYKTYSAREDYDEEGSAKKLSEGIKNSRYADSVTGISEFLNGVKEGDTVLALGAGDIYYIMKELIN